MSDETQRPITRADWDRAVESIATAISEVRGEVLDRIDMFGRRLDHQVEAVQHLSNLFSAISRAEDRLDKDSTALVGNHHALQRDVRELRSRVDALEKRAG
jgi:hypothetical protein